MENYQLKNTSLENYCNFYWKLQYVVRELNILIWYYIYAFGTIIIR